MSTPGRRDATRASPARSRLGSRPPVAHTIAGLTLVEALVAVTIVALALVVSLPALAQVRARAVATAAARHLAVSLHAVRWRSTTTGRAWGLEFVRDSAGWLWYEVEDGNHNGLRSSEIDDGTDRRRSGPHRLGAAVLGARLGLPPAGPFREIPPGRGWIDERPDPIRFGAADLVAFGPLGTASSGRLYVTDGREALAAVVLFGQTGRIRVWRYDRGSGRWLP